MDKLLAVIIGSILSVAGFFGVKPAPQNANENISVQAVEVSPTETPLPTETPTPVPTRIPTPFPTKIPATSTPDTKVQDLQKQIDDLKKQVSAMPTPRPKWACRNEKGEVIGQNERCPYSCDTPEHNVVYSSVECSKLSW